MFLLVIHSVPSSAAPAAASSRLLLLPIATPSPFGRSAGHGDGVTEVVAKRLAVCCAGESLPRQLATLKHDALVGKRQRAMHVLLDQDHRHTLLSGSAQTLEDAVDQLGSQP